MVVEVDVEVGGGVVTGVVAGWSPKTLLEKRGPALIQAWWLA